MIITDRRLAPAIVDAVDFKLELKPYNKFNLDNGVPVYSIDAGAEDVLMIEIVFFSGNSYEEKNLVAATTNYLIKNGTSTKTAYQINEHFEYYGSYLNRACYNETATITLHCLNKHVEELLPVVAELITDPAYPQDELDTYRQNMKQRLSVNLKKCDFVAGRIIDSVVYGKNHPYGRFTTHEEYDALTREELVDFYMKHYRNGQCIVFVAGKVPKNLNQLLNRSIGKLLLRKPEENNIPRQPPQPAGGEKKMRVVNDANGVQGAIRIAQPFPNRHHPDFLKTLVLNCILGGYFGSRLMKNIREEKGYTYGIYSYLQNHIQHSAWLVSTEAGKDVCEKAITEIYREMSKLCTEPVPEEEMMLVRNYMMGSILGELDGPFQVIARWKNIILNGLDGNYFYRSIDNIRKVTPVELMEIANKYLKPENFYELVVV